MKLYLAHPFSSRKEIREWELKIEKKIGIELINPFYDLNRKDVSRIDSGASEKFEGLNHTEIIQRDVGYIAISNGVVSIVNGETSYGTVQEMVYSKILQKPNYCLVTNGYENHPWIKYHSTKIFTKIEKLEKFLEKLS